MYLRDSICTDLTLEVSLYGALVCDNVRTEPEYCYDVALQALTFSYLTLIKGLVGVVFSIVDLAIIFNVSMILRERNLIATRTHIGVLVVLSITAAIFSLASVITWYSLFQPQLNRDISKKVGNFVVGTNTNPIGLASMVACTILGSIVGVWTSFLLYKGVGGHWNMGAWFGSSGVSPTHEKAPLLPPAEY